MTKAVKREDKLATKIILTELCKHIDEQKINIPSGFLMASYLTLFVQIYLHLLIYLVTLL